MQKLTFCMLLGVFLLLLSSQYVKWPAKPNNTYLFTQGIDMKPHNFSTVEVPGHREYILSLLDAERKRPLPVFGDFPSLTSPLPPPEFKIKPLGLYIIYVNRLL